MNISITKSHILFASNYWTADNMETISRDHFHSCVCVHNINHIYQFQLLLSGEPDYFGRNKISSGGDLSHYSSASLH